jgi:H+/Cl- antiporter ClcA
MESTPAPRTPSTRFRRLGLEAGLAVPIGLLAGSASALFLWSLDRVTAARWHSPWLLWLLPVVGFAVGWIYLRFGQKAERGTHLIMDEIHTPGGGVPARMAPLVLFGTLATHLCGGSAGREGTALQMGGSLADAFSRLCRIEGSTRRTLLIAGIAAGFGSVFGTPLAGAIFAIEVLVVGRLAYRDFLPALIASIVGDLTCSAWGIDHAFFSLGAADGTPFLAMLELGLVAKIIAAAVIFGMISRGFSEVTHRLQASFKRFVAYAPLRPLLGGLTVIALVYVLGSRDYLGIGVTSPDPKAVTLLSAFQTEGAEPWSWAGKFLFTTVTLASGFKGGEVTPLFFIGATLGHAIAVPLGAPVALFAGLGLIGVFAGATKTPLACTVLGLELFGAHYSVYFALVCFIAYYASGRAGIYPAQRRPEKPLPPDQIDRS